MQSSAAIRQQFLDYFQSKGHSIVPSAPIVVKDDPTLLFTNAGMNQFKDIFLGNKKPVAARVADTQKCLRVSGKHNDLEEVGVDSYHHTMFEMLGNWSFGDYFKAEAIEWSWDLLTNVYNLPKDRLYVTVFEGDEAEGLPCDEEAMAEWRKWIAPDRILMGSKKDNFWEMGDTGPCGPCTEIHFDTRSDSDRQQISGAGLVNADDPEVIEIWNNVFIQFNRLKDKSLQPLPSKHVDTGMGLERLVRVIQEKKSNYDTDLFMGTISATEEICVKEYDGSDSKMAIAFRVIADHIRAISFTIADGQLPSNTEAGYVIRRILRRAARYYYSYLDYKQPLLCQLVPVLAKQFEHVFPELLQQQDFVSKVVREEEESFLRTLEKGLKRIDEIMAQAVSGRIDGRASFELYDTYGFPIDLTQLLAAEKGLVVDIDEFNKAMEEQKQRSRKAGTVDAGDWVIVHEGDARGFTGYEQLEANTRLLRYRKVKAKNKEAYQLVLEETPFYAESGGQVGDTGTIASTGSKSIQVLNTQKENDLIIHLTEDLPQHPEALLSVSVDAGRRARIRAHHSATHLLHAALRNVLGEHVQQKGSLVNEDYLRFDFSHIKKISTEEIAAVEELVNRKIRENKPVEIREMGKDEAVALGAMALFGEKYGDRVRVVVMDPAYSIELCGGTHVQATGELGLFKIIQETAVAAGVRRIEAVAGAAALDFVNNELTTLQVIKEKFKNPKDLPKAIEQVQEELADEKKRAEHLENRLLVGVRNELLGKDEVIGDISFIGQIVEVAQPDALKKLCFDLKNNLNAYLVVLCANIGGKPAVAIGIDEKVVAAKNLDAGKMIKEIVAPLVKGGGGGQKTLATAGGQDASRLQEVINAVKAKLADL